MVSSATAYGAYVAGEEIGVSGVLAVVAAGLVVSRKAQDISDAPTRLRAGAFWESAAFVLNAILFLLVASAGARRSLANTRLGAAAGRG